MFLNFAKSTFHSVYTGRFTFYSVCIQQQIYFLQCILRQIYFLQCIHRQIYFLQCIHWQIYLLQCIHQPNAEAVNNVAYVAHYGIKEDIKTIYKTNFQCDEKVMFDKDYIYFLCTFYFWGEGSSYLRFFLLSSPIQNDREKHKFISTSLEDSINLARGWEGRNNENYSPILRGRGGGYK